MKTRREFCADLADQSLTHVQRAVALLWYYRQSQEFEERDAAELASDLHDEGFPKPRASRLRAELLKSKYVVRGKRQHALQLDARRIGELDELYSDLLGVRRVRVQGAIIPPGTVPDKRAYLTRLVHQINGAYECGFYDACAVLCRRLIESLLIEIYISQKRQHEIQSNGVFIHLDPLIKRATADKGITLGRNSPKTMAQVKEIGDTAAHDRTYITQQSDIDELKTGYRRLINELLTAAAIRS